ncbi:hypothetical protein DPMN_066795 [Dreissena polymorpha]|uniref:Uncharacterized protein n=1 Tax=Dreissena polymorpha TaxID=45954 RepID=A0A9D4BSC3_DREPO|nr:hypothetical protein DPMN_066795 [Dreissena polymorpha]
MAALMLAHESCPMPAHRCHDNPRKRILLDPCSEPEAAITTSGTSDGWIMTPQICVTFSPANLMTIASCRSLVLI